MKLKFELFTADHGVPYFLHLQTIANWVSDHVRPEQLFAIQPGAHPHTTLVWFWTEQTHRDARDIPPQRRP